MTPANKMLIRDYALDLKAAVQKQYYTDVILLTKERIKLKVHKGGFGFKCCLNKMILRLFGNAVSWGWRRKSF